MRQGMFDIAQRIAILITAAALLFAASAGGQELAPRQPLAKTPVRAVVPSPGMPTFVGDGPQYQLVVKFRDEVLARTTKGALISLAAADVAGAKDVARTFGMVFSPLCGLSEERLEQLEERAAARSGVAQPDLAGMLKVEIPGAGPAELEAAGEALQRLPEVEFAFIRTLGAPPPGPTPDYTYKQTYFEPDPGTNADHAWALGFTGSGIRLSDCEYGWNPDHEDLIDRDLNLEPGQVIHQSVYINGWHEHGTAVLGQTSAVVNSFGIDGMVPDAEVYTYPERTDVGGQQVDRRAEAICSAITDSGVGDVVLLEMQTDAGGPAEVDQDVWTVVKTGTDAGVIVVGAAGNGDQDLDSSAYAAYRARGDSGAIIVGAGSSDYAHNKLDFSTYGSRVDVQGWGENIFTLGYGDFITHDGDPNRNYRHTFGGTSGASPFAAAAAVAIQEAAGTPLSPQSLRDLLIQSGIPQGTGDHIGPAVNMGGALDMLLGYNDKPVCQDDYFSTTEGTGLTILFNTDLLPNDDDPDDDFLRVWDYDRTTAEGGSNSTTNPFGFIYTPPFPFTGTDSFSYTISDRSDGTGLYDVCTIFIDVTCDQVFADSFDSGNFKNWSSTAKVGNATLDVTAAAAMEGPFGMHVTVQGAGDRAYVRDQSPAAETVYRASFLLRFDATMSSGNLHRILSIQDASPATNVVLVNMRKSGLLTQLRAQARRDNGTWAYTSWLNVAPQTPVAVGVEWRAAGAGQSNGSLDFVVDGQTEKLTGLDNDSFQVDRTYLGLVNGVDAGTDGDFHFDAFESCRD